MIGCDLLFADRNQQNPSTSWAEVLFTAHMLRVNYLAKHKLLSDLETFDLGFAEAKRVGLFLWFSVFHVVSKKYQKILASGIPPNLSAFVAHFFARLCAMFEWLWSSLGSKSNRSVACDVEPSLWTSLQHLPSGDCYTLWWLCLGNIFELILACGQFTSDLFSFDHCVLLFGGIESHLVSLDSRCM